MPEIAYIGLGSNLGDRRGVLDAALARLRPLRVSRVVETAPWGRADQPDFLNAVAEVDTDLEPEPLLDRLLSLERELGRTRDPGGERWGPRRIDLDLLLYGSRRLRNGRLEVPHPRISERRFVLEGLAELCPDHPVPGLGRTVRDLLEECP